MNLIIISFLFVFIHSSSLADLQQEFLRVGCSESGLLFPSTLNVHGWQTLKHKKELLTSLRVSNHSSLAARLCKGVQNSPHTLQSSQIFHASWECYDEDMECKLPTANVQTLQTARYHHPNAKLILWSNSLPLKIASLPEVEVRRYDHSLFENLPPNARLASEAIPLFFDKTPNSHSHFSDLLRVAILYQFGGIWMDLDSLFLDSVAKVTQREWLPKTFHNGVDFAIEDDNGKRFIIEGGMMKFEAGSPFLLSVLENFPKYDAQTAQCWACVGPKLLTETYMTTTLATPALVPSSRLFGNNHYRVTLEQAFLTHGLDLQILQEHINNNAVAVHLFTSSGERTVEPGSLIDLFLRSSGVVDGLVPEEMYVPLGQLSRRRHLQNFEDSVQYDFHFVYFQLRIFSPSIDGMKEQQNQDDLRNGLAQTMFISSDVIDLEVMERHDVVLVDVRAQTNSAKAVDTVNAQHFLWVLNAILGGSVVVQESTQAVEADLNIADLEDFNGRPQIQIPTSSPTSSPTPPPTESPTTKTTTMYRYREGNPGDTCDNEGEMIRDQSECADALLQLGYTNLGRFWVGSFASIPAGCSIRNGGDLQAHLENSPTGLGNGRIDLVPICRIRPSQFPSPPLSTTSIPTTSPTSFPTSHPTTSPTSEPTPSPTFLPTPFPTTGPTTSPTTFPTTGPTTNPTTGPTTNPTTVPTTHPSTHPTTFPTTHPSTHPTTFPTTNPTTFPTTCPTTNPTTFPTTCPTTHPTTYPTTGPSPGPTFSPTILPTTSHPSTHPTSSPTTGPSPFPTFSPTALPTRKPTNGPSPSPIQNLPQYLVPDLGLIDSMKRVLQRNYNNDRLKSAGQRAGALLQEKDEQNNKVAPLYDPDVKSALQKIKRFWKNADMEADNSADYTKQRNQYNRIAEILGLEAIEF